MQPRWARAGLETIPSRKKRNEISPEDENSSNHFEIITKSDLLLSSLLIGITFLHSQPLDGRYVKADRRQSERKTRKTKRNQSAEEMVRAKKKENV